MGKACSQTARIAAPLSDAIARRHAAPSFLETVVKHVSRIPATRRKPARAAPSVSVAKLRNCQTEAACKPLAEKANSEGGKPPYNDVYGPFPPSPQAPPPPATRLIIGFDSEWVQDGPERNRLLSYQYACRLEGREWSGVIYPDSDPRAVDKGKGPRLKFADILGTAIAHGIALGALPAWPRHVIAAAHWTRADLAHVADFAYVKRRFKGIKKTYASLGRPYRARAFHDGHTHRFLVSLVDTQLLVPSTTKALEKLGELYRFEKLDPGKVTDERGAEVDAKKCMDLLLAANRDLFERYAIRDAEICALHVEKMIAFVRDDLGLGADVPATLGSLTVDYLLKLWEERGVDPGAVNGYRLVRESRFNKRRGKGRLTKIERRYSGKYLIHQKIAELCFLGGRNECFWYGPTADMDPERWPPSVEGWDFAAARPVMVPMAFREYDLTAAYATALASLCIPDYDKARPTTDPADFRVDQLGFARVKFRFPATTRFPCLPVKDADEHGLIYPLRGEAYVTAPEIVLALRMGAEIEIIDGVVIPWVEDSPRPFELVIHELSRRRAEHPKGSLQNEMFKQLGNSIYGKLGQGIKEKSYFNTRTDTYEDGRPCPITNPYLAAHVTGLIRALVSEMLAGLHPRHTVVSVTTDAFITNASHSEISMTGPVALHMNLVRARLTAAPETQHIGVELLETKFEVRQLVPWRNKGVASLKTCVNDPKDKKPKLAQGGMRAPAGTRDQNGWFVGTMLDRQYDTMWENEEPLPFPLAHRTNADHVFRKRLSRVNFEYDMKRQLVDPSPSYVAVPGEADRFVQHVSCNTIPWETIEDFQRARYLFEQWRHKKKGHLKTTSDFDAWSRYADGDHAAQAGVNRRGDVVGQARRLFLRAYTRGMWGLPGDNYRHVAEVLTAAGYPTTEQHLKDAKRAKGDVPEHVIPADAPGVADFMRALIAAWPAFDWQRLVDGELPTDAAPTGELPELRIAA